ncbi:hypothetical protein [Rothia sp. ZJ932]|uniref:hypothetical protein n=1 Tax=Rothia sp. ZJ932 TaxID=2810516 RepID=UPI0019671983|nr:hypothetical protein [Rothia sp. ZJ932]QRZ61652.1 hypothetical protein JR346_00420 [Rothia sp. ZJ932]
MTQKRGGMKEQIKGPLLIAVGLALVAFFGVVLFATGGTNNPPKVPLAASVSGAVFVVTLVMCATLMMIETPNDESLGKGSGINRSSAKLYAEARAKREAAAREASKNKTSSAQHSDSTAHTPEQPSA